jgi:hypothetical protein
MSDRRGISFRDSAITFVFMIGIVAALSVALLVLLDPRAQAFWGSRFSAFGAAARALVDQLPWPR